MRFIFGFLFGGILGVIGGAVLMVVAFPFLFPPPMVNETVDNPSFTPVASAEFRQNVAGHDAVHWGRGDIRIYRKPSGNYVVEFQSNFEVGPGPNFWLYVNAEADIDDENDFKADRERARITKIKSFSGSQVYEIPSDIVEAGAAISIWCESFDQYIASANYVLN